MRNQAKEDIAALTALRNARLAERAKALKQAATSYLVCKRTGESFLPAVFGFEFSIPEIEAAAAQSKAQSDAALAEHRAFLARKAA